MRETGVGRESKAWLWLADVRELALTLPWNSIQGFQNKRCGVVESYDSWVRGESRALVFLHQLQLLGADIGEVKTCIHCHAVWTMFLKPQEFRQYGMLRVRQLSEKIKKGGVYPKIKLFCRTLGTIASSLRSLFPKSFGLWGCKQPVEECCNNKAYS